MPTEAYAHGGLCPMPTEAYAHEYLIFRSKGYISFSYQCVTLVVTNFYLG